MYLTQEKEERLVELAKKLDKAFPGQHQYYRRFIGIQALKNDIDIDSEQIKEMMKYIKAKTRMFSNFRTSRFIIATLLTLNYNDPEAAFDRLISHEEMLKAYRFKQGLYLPMTCYCLDAMLFDDSLKDNGCKTESYIEDLVSRGKDVYDSMKSSHPWITGGDDYALALLIGHGKKEIEKIEEFYIKLVGAGLSKGNGLQGLSNILTLSDKPDYVLIERIQEILQLCKEEGFRVSQTIYPAIGLICLLSDEDDYIKEGIELTKAFRKVAKYKWIDRNLLFLFAVSLISEEVKQSLVESVAMNTTINISIEQLIMAQTALMVAAVSTGTVAASSSN